MQFSLKRKPKELSSFSPVASRLEWRLGEHLLESLTLNFWTFLNVDAQFSEEWRGTPAEDLLRFPRRSRAAKGTNKNIKAPGDCFAPAGKLRCLSQYFERRECKQSKAREQALRFAITWKLRYDLHFISIQ